VSKEKQSPRQLPSNARTISFIVALSLVCALILSLLASSLRVPQEMAKNLDRSQQMMISARIMNPKGYFQVKNEKGEYVPAEFAEGTYLVPSDKIIYPTRDQTLAIYRKRLISLLVDDQGNVTTFEKENINEEKYLAEHKKEGYYRLPLKLLYEILPNAKEVEGKKPIGYVIPVNGYGLWDAIYGYIAIETDGNTVIGISWYEQKETPGLGANISDASWQKQFHGKKIFKANMEGETEFKTAPIGITVVRGEVKNVIGNNPKAKSAVDGMSGATLTGNGVTEAYKDVLSAYRPFFIKLHKENE